MEKISTIDLKNPNYTCKIIAYGPILDYQEERISTIHHLLAVASGNGDYHKVQELKNLMFIEEDILAEMKRKCNR